MTMSATPELKPWRCPSCQHILARIALEPGSKVVIKCRCNEISTKEGGRDA